MKGLRREEVAVLAGVSADYYIRLEQGRETNPSPQVVDALGSALRLGADARTHLFRLAGINPRTKADSFRDQVHPDLLRLLDAFPTTAAYVMGPPLDILATNERWSARRRRVPRWRRGTLRRSDGKRRVELERRCRAGR
ncbi:helix-turn-helix domain-containing protein [Streptomyces mirabilis]|uniref:Helix-turn-helix domain-containing protein n=1 Tax=Streptomyces mirabilis TaxID=68239 RepID=A0A1I2S1R4_9ACTN|nr:Helix-turn-helix domain-containing protein [Streptomyces mirabilis]